MTTHSFPARWFGWTTPYAAMICMVLAILALLMLGGGPLSSIAAAQDQPAPPSDGDSGTPATADHAAPVSTAIFTDDFEAFGDSSQWSRSHPFTVDDELVANGEFAARMSNFGGAPMYGQKTFRDAYSRLYVRLRFSVVEIKDRSVTLVQLRSGPSSSILSVQIDPSGAVSYKTSATGVNSTSIVTAVHGKWHELQVLVDTESSHRNIRIWLDGAELTTMRQDAFLDESLIRMMDLGDNSAGQFSEIAFDDVVIDDTFIATDRQADPVSGTLLVRAIPAESGIAFELDGQQFLTDDEGNARIKVNRWSTDLRSRITVHPRYHDDGSVSTFTGWRSWLSPQSRDVFATFKLGEPITFSFVDELGAAVDTSLIDLMVIKSSTGDIHTLNSDQLNGTVLLTSSIITTPTGLHLHPITYYVDSVYIGGANVVNRAQQRATFENNRSMSITLLFFGVKFQATDALFGTSLGTDVLIESADGTRQTLPLDGNGEVIIPRLPRGEYSVSVLGAGYSPPRPIMVSRDQVIQLEVISKLDVMLILSIAAVAVLGLLVIGRPHLVTVPFMFVRSVLAHPTRLRWWERTI